MIGLFVEYALNNRFIVLTVTVLLLLWGDKEHVHARIEEIGISPAVRLSSAEHARYAAEALLAPMVRQICQRKLASAPQSPVDVSRDAASDAIPP